ncbi:response regulator transcription factor [Streptomyces sp. SID3343]|uniref:response regulator n=1 Tax=Streptomyces sp. SID3343 TaxID=2690260 RepID=UPI00136D7627|nr:response regulator transcription factor [Streptomyces sp. SID3343]MYW04252.1 response regulator [Streptomyces sp. SID3343]
MKVRVLIADDQLLVRSGFKVLVGSDPELEVVGEAANGAEAVALAKETRADVVLMDIRMPGMDGLEATRRIVRDDDLAGVRVLVLTTFEVDDYVFEALRAGASGFLVKDTDPEDLLKAIKTVASGDALLSPGATRALVSRFLSQPEPKVAKPDRLEALTDREREVLSLVAAGMSNDEIAEHLFVSPLTAKTHVSRAMVKLGARDRAQLVVIAYESGMVRPGRG